MPSASRSIEQLQTLVSLPRSIDALKGCSKAAVVWSSRSRKKRPEVVAAVDGEGVNIYNIQSPQLVASYAVSPQTYFTSQPFSIYVKRKRGEPAFRYTYVSVRDSSRSRSSRIVVFVETVQRAGSGNTRKYHRDLPEAADSVFSIETVHNKQSTLADQVSHHVLVIYKDGRVQSLSEDLSRVHWETSLEALASSYDRNFSSSNSLIQFVGVTNTQAAKEGLLKNREDVLAAVNPAHATHSHHLASTDLLVIITQSSVQSSHGGKANNVHILAIPTLVPDKISSLLPPLRYLLRQELPHPFGDSIAEQKSLDFMLHASSGHIYQLFQNALVTYDLTDMLPKVASSLIIQDNDLTSFARMSSSLILTSSPTSSTLYDVRYKTVQAVVSFSTIEEPKGSRKRKISGSLPSEAGLQYITHFADLGLVVGLTRHEIVGQNVNPSAPKITSKGHMKAGRTLLIDSVGKGVKGDHCARLEQDTRMIAPFEAIVPTPNSAWEKTWRPFMESLEQCVLADDVHNFERIFASSVSIALEPEVNTDPPQTRSTHASTISDVQVQDSQRSEKMTNGVSNDEYLDEPLPDWDFSNFVARGEQRQPGNRRKAIYALSKMFSWSPIATDDIGETKSNPSLEITFYAPNVLKWLIKTGFLNCELLETALRPSGSVGDRLRSIPPEDIISTCVEFDSSLRLLYVLLQDHPFLECPQIVQSIKVLIQSLDNHAYMGGNIDADESRTHLLTNGLHDDANDDDEQAVPEELERVVSGIEAASNDLDLALSTLEDGLSIRSLSLRTAFSRLNAFPSLRVAEALRQHLTNHEIIFLVQLLRIELADGGWTSRYIDVGPRGLHSDPSDSGDPSDRGLLIISNLLSCALDAIGAGGWLVAGMTNAGDESDEMLLSLRAEISAALEGIHEASFMKGVLNDFLRYANMITGQRKAQHDDEANGSSRGRNKPITVEREDDPMKRVLPLGFKVERSVGSVKVSTGGELRKKSAREIGNEISRRVGRYTLERIVV